MLARVVAFEAVSNERIEQMKAEIEGSEPPAEIPAKEILILHDPEAETALAIVFFETDEDYRRGDAALSAMPAGDTPGRRVSVAKYDVVVRVTA